MAQSDSRERLLAEASTSDTPISISIRDLLSHWGAKRRGYWIVERIERDLRNAGLTTEPPFTEGWIDQKVALTPIQEREDAEPVDTPPQDEQPPRSSLRVSNLASASSGVESVPSEQSLLKAQSIMMKFDYSQLAVMSGERDLKGAISWESIAQALLKGEAPKVRDATVRARVVRTDDDLISQIPTIVESDFVFVQAEDRTITGIITTADLSQQFSELANPFLLVGEIERRLRRAIDEVFDPEELEEARNPNEPGRQINSADDLTMGEFARLLEAPDSWEKLGWPADRTVFVQGLNEVREIRNEVMHFSPDPLEEAQIGLLRTFNKWLEHLTS